MDDQITPIEMRLADLKQISYELQIAAKQWPGLTNEQTDELGTLAAELIGAWRDAVRTMVERMIESSVERG